MSSSPDATWWYCIHCSRCFEDRSANRWTAGADDPVEKGLKKCPYTDCDGTPLDFWEWDEHRESFSKDYPEVPTPDVVYPMYPKSS